MIKSRIPVSGKIKNSVLFLFLNTVFINVLFLNRVTEHGYIRGPFEDQIFILHDPRVLNSYILTFTKGEGKPRIIMNETAYHRDLIAISTLHTDGS